MFIKRKKYFLISVVCFCVSLLILSTSVALSFSDCITTESYEEDYEIIIEKTVWDCNKWAEYTEVDLGDIVHFKGVVYNPNCYHIDFSGVIYDKLPDNLEYIVNSSTLLELPEPAV